MGHRLDSRCCLQDLGSKADLSGSSNSLVSHAHLSICIVGFRIRPRLISGEVMIEVLLSDIDGTLVDSNALHAEAWRRTFEHFGIQVGMDEAWSQIGKGGDKLIPVFVKESDRDRLKKEMEDFRKQVFHRDYMPRIVSFSRSRDLFERVKQSGTKIVLATSSIKEDVDTYKRIIGIEDLVDEVASAS